jgi:hypothetical protein
MHGLAWDRSSARKRSPSRPLSLHRFESARARLTRSPAAVMNPTIWPRHGRS